MDFSTFGKTYPKVTDFTTNKDPDGIQIQYDRTEAVVQLSGSCIEGDKDYDPLVKLLEVRSEEHTSELQSH